jgi:hypothetical protein
MAVNRLPALSNGDKIGINQPVFETGKHQFTGNAGKGVSDYQGLRNCKPARPVKY